MGGRGRVVLLKSERRVKFRVVKTIRRWWPFVNAILSFVVGNERRVNFWRDNWHGEASFSVPSLSCLLLLGQRSLR